MALTSFTIFGRAWGRVNPLTSSQEGVVTKQYAPLIFLARSQRMRPTILYVLPEHLPGLPSWYPSRDAAFGRRCAGTDTLRFVTPFPTLAGYCLICALL